MFLVGRGYAMAKFLGWIVNGVEYPPKPPPEILKHLQDTLADAVEEVLVKRKNYEPLSDPKRAG